MDEALARKLSKEWLGDEAVLTAVDAMNSSTWLVAAPSGRFALKVSSPADAPGLAAASWLEAHGVPTGAPVRTAVVDGRLVALLHFLEGRGLEATDAERIGEVLGRVHARLVGAPVPDGMDRWPWKWLDPSVIGEPWLRAAAESAVAAAVALAPSLSHGVLHGDPAPEAFLEAGGAVGLIDWGAAVHGPLLYDVASAWMYVREDPALLDGYARTGPLSTGELRHTRVFLAFRWAVQAWYFAGRLARGDLTGLESQADNEEGLADAREAFERSVRIDDAGRV